MSKALLVLFATSVGLGFVSLHLVRELRAERANVQSLQARVAELEREEKASPMHPAMTPPAALPATSETTDPPAAVLPARQPAIASAAADGAAPRMPSHEERMRHMREAAERQRTLLRDPEYREAMRMQHRMMLARTHPDLARELGFSTDEADQLLSLLAEQQLRGMENMGPGWMGESPDPAAIEELQRKAQQQHQANEMEIAALLGDARLQQWKDYQATMGVRHQVAQLGSTLAGKGAPLQEDQSRSLLKALAAEQQRAMQDWNNFNNNAARVSFQGNADAASRMELQEEQLRQTTQHQQRLRDAVSPILTSEQLRHFEEEQNQNLRMQQAHMRMMRAQAEAEARGEISPPVMPGMPANALISVSPGGSVVHSDTPAR